jgi:hypothetical protein
MNLNFNVGDIISIDEISYTIRGKITYVDDDYIWDEYKLINSSDGSEEWLSIDNEDSIVIWKMTGKVDTTGMEQTDSGTEYVQSYYGNVDVETDDSARYTEYFDSSTQTYVSIEVWDDETEYSLGTAVKADSIVRTHENTFSEQPPSYTGNNKDSDSLSKLKKFGGCLGIFVIVCILTAILGGDSTIKSKLDENVAFPLETAITGYDKQMADVYSTDYDSDMAARNIIDLIEGNASYVQENPGDTLTIAILTKNELCLVYRDIEDSSTLVHVATRKWTLDNLDTPLYHADSLTNNFYRGFYQYYALATDTTDNLSDTHRYRHYHHHYGTYFGSVYLLSNSRYERYSTSVREASAARRSSSGGGHGGGGK